MIVNRAVNSDTFQVTTPADREIRMTRLFNAPRQLVFDAMNKPEHVRRWWGLLDKAHVNLILPGPPDTYADPDGLLEGDGKTGRHLEVRSVDQLPQAPVRGWLRTAAAQARKQK